MSGAYSEKIREEDIHILSLGLNDNFSSKNLYSHLDFSDYPLHHQNGQG